MHTILYGNLILKIMVSQKTLACLFWGNVKTLPSFSCFVNRKPKQTFNYFEIVFFKVNTKIKEVKIHKI